MKLKKWNNIIRKMEKLDLMRIIMRCQKIIERSKIIATIVKIISLKKMKTIEKGKTNNSEFAQ